MLALTPLTSDPEAAVLEALAERLEAALDLVASAAAVDHLTEIAQLCGEAEVLARAGALLLRPR